MARAWASAPSWKQRCPNPDPNSDPNPNPNPNQGAPPKETVLDVLSFRGALPLVRVRVRVRVRVSKQP
eukprot:scaffold29800_cov82-Phaeocystis_antarctica.AAC.1